MVFVYKKFIHGCLPPLRMRAAMCVESGREVYQERGGQGVLGNGEGGVSWWGRGGGGGGGDQQYLFTHNWGNNDTLTILKLNQVS
jgi:hypothetical protein